MRFFLLGTLSHAPLPRRRPPGAGGRQYCARRLIRLHKKLGFLHGRGKFARRELDEAAVTDARHLHIPLVTAERAWAYAMELKVPRKNTR